MLIYSAMNIYGSIHTNVVSYVYIASKKFGYAFYYICEIRRPSAIISVDTSDINSYFLARSILVYCV